MGGLWRKAANEARGIRSFVIKKLGAPRRMSCWRYNLGHHLVFECQKYHWLLRDTIIKYMIKCRYKIITCFKSEKLIWRLLNEYSNSYWNIEKYEWCVINYLDVLDDKPFIISSLQNVLFVPRFALVFGYHIVTMRRDFTFKYQQQFALKKSINESTVIPNLMTSHVQILHSDNFGFVKSLVA